MLIASKSSLRKFLLVVGTMLVYALFGTFIVPLISSPVLVFLAAFGLTCLVGWLYTIIIPKVL